MSTVSPSAYTPSRPSLGAAGWVAVMDDGRRITIDGLVLLGRNPQPQPGEEDAQLIKLADETRTVSKSHLAIGVDAGRALRDGPRLDQRVDGDHPDRAVHPMPAHEAVTSVTVDRVDR